MLNRKGITVHVSDCETLQHYEEDPNLWVNLSWDKTAAPKNFTGSIKIVLRNIPGALAEVTLEIAKNEANISNFKTVSRERDFFEINLDIEIQNQKQLANIISAVKSKHCVHSIERIIK
jgi:GTP pyrophosphokinase